MTMAHTHENCTTPQPFGPCNSGMLMGPCYEDCPNEDCTVVRHCECKCHSGKTCVCNKHTWPRMVRLSSELGPVDPGMLVPIDKGAKQRREERKAQTDRNS